MRTISRLSNAVQKYKYMSLRKILQDVILCVRLHFFSFLGLILPSSFSVVVFTFQCKWVVAEERREFCFVVLLPAVKGRQKKVEKKECENRYNDGNRALKLLETFPQKVWNAQCASWLFRWRCFSLQRDSRKSHKHLGEAVALFTGNAWKMRCQTPQL